MTSLTLFAHVNMIEVTHLQTVQNWFIVDYVRKVMYIAENKVNNDSHSISLRYSVDCTRCESSCGTNCQQMLTHTLTIPSHNPIVSIDLDRVHINQLLPTKPYGTMIYTVTLARQLWLTNSMAEDDSIAHTQWMTAQVVVYLGNHCQLLLRQPWL